MTERDSEAEFMDRLLRTLGDVPLDDSEVKEVLREHGIDTKPGLALLLAKVNARVEELEAAELDARVEDAGAKRLEALKRLKAAAARPTVARSRPELLARLAELSARLPRERRPQAYHRDFESANTEDLALLVAEIEELVDRETKK